ncbi:hypothetical protein B1C78_00600 [Thioalkalivibrio denitrificans]|uniref:Single-stranded DNA-binding protein n=1 Tax=Thioalkalivibrio denitrificans TaxID=108003 RepID=A0A1V3NVW2_9GAMM|nr:single-stranded DNA-binding protein [Thioalkalivibrio denitrificans]OOG28866.1 hypothetical protein B1C78_00600 [Thioalkalivibrio denitrificans]
MSAEFIGSGNLGAAPVLRKVEVDGETRAVADLRIFFDRPKQQPDGSYSDDGGFWMNVSVWGRKAEDAVRVLAKGTRVRVEGRLREHSWEGDEGERTEMRLTADHVTLELGRVDTVTFKAP